ncbi:MAG TPA: methylmalonyl-CoA mutase family protein [Pseudolabrys sp.]|jgi:methylmalonyl-CoA mutase|nr:methylmalonyl-CoA mutase family protein [Pseudolabrys sp.]
MSDNLPLAAEFPPTTRDDWRKLVETALKGASFDKRLVSQTYDGLRVEPLYPRAASAPVIAGRPAVPWQVIQRVDHPDAKTANKQALDDLENGATGLSLVFAGSVGAYGYGLDGTKESIATVLDGVYLDTGIALELDLSAQHKDAGQNLAAVLKERGIAPDKTQIRFGYDPLGAKARSGSSPLPWPQIAKLFAEIVADLSARGLPGPFAVADGRHVHAAGGSEAQELAFVIANAVEYLRVFTQAGISLEAARKLVWFRLAADTDEFLTIAKLRALRKLWARIEEASGLTPKPAFLSAETAWRMMSTRDPYVNMLRTTIAVTAAGVGGADAISALPFTIALGLPDAFARRLARNMQLILLEESNLYRVTDPAAGAGGVEALTAEIAKAAWTLFQEIEVAGGAAIAIEQGLVQKKVAATRAERLKAIARRKDALTGVSDYPDLGELPVKVLDVPRVSVPPMPASITFEGLPPMRLAEPFEALRDASDRALAKTGTRPKVFLANLGKLSDFTARATFAKNFYEAAGIETVTNDGFKSQADMVAAFKASGAKLACLCSSDKVYESEAPSAAKTLAAAGALVHLAGRPGDKEQSWRQAGVKDFIYMGCDALSTLQAVHGILGFK